MSSEKPHNWSNHLRSCNDDKRTCNYAFACPCLVYGKTAAHCGYSKNFCSVLYAIGLSSCLYWTCGLFMRRKIAKDKNIKFSCCNDLFIHCCCCCCALEQELREMYRFQSINLPYAPTLIEKQEHDDEGKEESEINQINAIVSQTQISSQNNDKSNDDSHDTHIV